MGRWVSIYLSVNANRLIICRKRRDGGRKANLLLFLLLLLLLLLFGIYRIIRVGEGEVEDELRINVVIIIPKGTPR